MVGVLVVLDPPNSLAVDPLALLLLLRVGRRPEVAKSVLLALLPVARVLSPVFPGESAFSVPLIVQEASIVFSAVRPF